MVNMWLQFPSCNELSIELWMRLYSVLLHDYILTYFLILRRTVTPLDYPESVIQTFILHIKLTVGVNVHYIKLGMSLRGKKKRYLDISTLTY